MLTEHFLWENRNDLTFICLNKNIRGKSSDPTHENYVIGIPTPDFGFINLTQQIANETSHKYYPTGTVRINPTKQTVKEFVSKYLLEIKNKRKLSGGLGNIKILEI